VNIIKLNINNINSTEKETQINFFGTLTLKRKEEVKFYKCILKYKDLKEKLKNKILKQYLEVV
jgi:hypothetical protein